MTIEHEKRGKRAAVPKYKKLAQQLRAQIQSGELKPGDRLPSFSGMRAQFGATPTTVEWVFAELERDGLIVRQRGRGTFVAEPNQRVLTGTIGVGGISFAPMYRHPYWSRFLGGVQEATEAAGMEILLINDASFVRWEKIDGLIICEHRPSERIYQVPEGLPRVLALSQSKEISCVAPDEFQGIYDATQHLLQLGHRRIGYLAETHLKERFNGYKAALSDAAIKLEKGWAFTSDQEVAKSGTDYFDMGRSMMARWLARDWREQKCTALITQNDDVALGAIQSLREAGFEVPDDVSIVGFDGTEIGEYSQPRLTTVQVPLHAIGADAAQLLIQQLQNSGSEPRTAIHKVTLKKRASTRAL